MIFPGGDEISAQQTGKTAYRVKAESIEACNCQHGCNCQFAGFPNEGKCEFVVGFDVKDGRFGNVSLNGLRAVVAAKYPKAIHEGHGHVVLVEKLRPQGPLVGSQLDLAQEVRVESVPGC